MNLKRTEIKLGIIAFIVFSILKVVGFYVEAIEISNLVEFIRGMCVGLCLVAIVSTFISDMDRMKIKKIKSRIK